MRKTSIKVQRLLCFSVRSLEELKRRPTTVECSQAMPRAILHRTGRPEVPEHCPARVPLLRRPAATVLYGRVPQGGLRAPLRGMPVRANTTKTGSLAGTLQGELAAMEPGTRPQGITIPPK